MVEEERKRNGRNAETTFCIVDAQSVKNTDTAERKGYDAGKKVSGIKRHIAVDILGLPHAIYITTANVTDRDGAVLMFNNKKEKLCNVINVLADGGYSGEKFAGKIKEIIGSTVEVVKSRSQNENRHQAIKKLKLQIAIFTAGPVIDNFRVDVSISNSEYFINAAKVFDTLKKYNFSVSDTAKELNISTSRLIKFLARDEFLWREVNAERERLGMKKLKV